MVVLTAGVRQRWRFLKGGQPFLGLARRRRRLRLRLRLVEAATPDGETQRLLYQTAGQLWLQRLFRPLHLQLGWTCSVEPRQGQALLIY